MKKLIYTLLFTFIGLGVWAQSESLFTHFMFNKLNYNPAYAGSKEVLDMAAIYRNQWWSGIDGAPRTLNVFAHLPFGNYRNGAGINIITDKIGLDRALSLGLNYAYRIKFNEKNTLAAGLGARFENARADWDLAQVIDLVDNSVGVGEQTNSIFNVGAGLYFTNPNFYLGLSIPRILKNALYEDADNFSGSVNSYYFNGGLILDLTQKVKFYPNVMVSLNPNVPFEFDINANFLFMDALWLGATYRFEDSIDGLIQYEFDKGLRVGFAIDFTTSELKQVTTGSFEVLVGYTFPCEDCKILNLRYF